MHAHQSIGPLTQAVRQFVLQSRFEQQTGGTMDSKQVSKPTKRSYLRGIVGREYYTLRRRFKWLANSRSFARQEPATKLEHSIFRHKTMMLRPLRDVEMYLQHNKITNLRLAIAPINGVILIRGSRFRYGE